MAAEGAAESPRDEELESGERLGRAQQFQGDDTAEEAAQPKGPADLEKRAVRVALWLKKIYGDQPVPVYEMNERAVDILHDLMECNEARDRDVSLVIEGMKDQETEYEAATEEMQDILKDLGLSLNSLSRKATKSLNDLVRSAVTLETKDTSLTSFFCAISNMTTELFETESKNNEMQWTLHTLKKKLTAVQMLESRVLEDIENITKSQQVETIRRAGRVNNLKFLKDKDFELKIRIKNTADELIDRGLERSLTHEALVQLSEELVPLRKKIASLKKELKNYYDLPPSIPLAQVMVAEEKRKLNALEEELSMELDKLTFEFT